MINSIRSAHPTAGPAPATDDQPGRNRLRRPLTVLALAAALLSVAGPAVALPRVGGGGDGGTGGGCRPGYYLDDSGVCRLAPAQVAAPTGLTASAVRSNGATLTWTDTTRDESAFTVVRTEQTTAGTAHSTVLPTVSVAAGQTSFSVQDYAVQPNETVYWDVVATKPGATSSGAARTGALTVTLPANAPAAAVAFQHDWQSSAFTSINKADVLTDALRIVASPKTAVYQGQTGGCGPATAELELALRNPDRFVQIMQSLADNGAFTSDGVTYSASSDLRASAPAPMASPANWLFMATLRDSGNLVMRITGSTPGDSPAWISPPGEVDDWLAHIVGLHNTTATGLVWPFTTGQSVLPGAASVLANHGAVVLLINASMLDGSANPVNTPNHYVDLQSITSMTATTVSFSVVSWGRTYTFDNMSWDHFNSLTFDVLTAS